MIDRSTEFGNNSLLSAGGRMQTNLVKQTLKAGKCVYGTSLEDCLDPEIAVLLAAAGIDFFFIDTEHSPANYSQIQALCRSGRSAGIMPLVRVTENAAIPGVDALFIGPYDLTLALGIIGQFENPIFWQAVDRVIKAADKAGVGAGLQSRDMPLLLEARSRGARFLLYSSDVGVL